MEDACREAVPPAGVMGGVAPVATAAAAAAVVDLLSADSGAVGGTEEDGDPRATLPPIPAALAELNVAAGLKESVGDAPSSSLDCCLLRDDCCCCCCCRCNSDIIEGSLLMLIDCELE